MTVIEFLSPGQTEKEDGGRRFSQGQTVIQTRDILRKQEQPTRERQKQNRRPGLDSGLWCVFVIWLTSPPGLSPANWFLDGQEQIQD